MSQKRFPAYYISHGGGPWPWMPELRKKVFPVLEKSLVDMVAELDRQPKAILMISGHWEAKEVRIQSSATPGMEYDYYGFPSETYEVVYPSPGAPELAAQIKSMLDAAGIKNELDPNYGYDHGTFVPAYIMYPEANVPLIQLSLLQGYDPKAHFKIGEVLASLRDQDVMIIGSGLSYHNLRAMRTPASWAPSAEFDGWLYEAMSLPTEERWNVVQKWKQAPSALACHPKEDHFAPIFVALGAAGEDEATRIYHDTTMMGGVHASSYRFG